MRAGAVLLTQQGLGAHPMSDADLFARCARAWAAFDAHERRGLSALADLDHEALAGRAWQELEGGDRERLLFAMRQAVALGDGCRRILT